MPQTISELELIGSKKSSLARPHGSTTLEERRPFDEFLSIHEDVIRSVIRRFRFPREVVDDLTQKVWAKVIAGLERRRLGPALVSVTAWVVKIANDVATEHARQQARRRQESLAPEMANELADPEPGPDIEFESMQNGADLRKLIEEFIARLEREEDQRVARLRWLEESSLSRITVDMMISEDTASGILRRLRLKLADYLRPLGYGAARRKNERIFRSPRR